MVLGSLGSVVVGTLSDVAGWAAAFGVLAALLGAEAALAVGGAVGGRRPAAAAEA